MFEVFLHRRVLKFLEKLKEDKKRIFQAIEKLSDPFSQPYEKLRRTFTELLSGIIELYIMSIRKTK